MYLLTHSRIKKIAPCKEYCIFVGMKTTLLMKKTRLLLCFLFYTTFAFAQTEKGGTKDFGGFMLDMGAMLETSGTGFSFLPPTLNFDLELPQEGMLKLNPDAFTLPSTATYSSGYTLSPYSIYSYLYPHAGGAGLSLQGATYRLGNGMKFSTYGEYDADGNKVNNPHKLPWEKNNFNAAFELKSANGKFGIRLEVKQGRNYLY